MPHFLPPFSRLLSLTGLLLVSACTDVDQTRPPKARVPVRSEVVEAGPFRPALALFGKVEPASRLEVRAALDGDLYYENRFVDGLRTGARVRAGEPLFRIDNEGLRLGRTEAELELRSAEDELARAHRGVDEGFLPAMELKKREIAAQVARERLASFERRLERMRFAAPRAGILFVERVIPHGAEINAGTLLAEISADGPPRVEAWATAADLERLRPGLEVVCLRPGSGDVAGQGILSEVARQVGRGGTVRLVITIEENRAMPPPGEGLDVEIRLEKRTAALTLPEEAVLVDGGAASVFVLEPFGTEYKARLRLVLLGTRSAGRIEILDGLRDGERVAVRGTEFLADGLLSVEAEEGSAF